MTDDDRQVFGQGAGFGARGAGGGRSEGRRRARARIDSAAELERVKRVAEQQRLAELERQRALEQHRLQELRRQRDRREARDAAANAQAPNTSRRPPRFTAPKPDPASTGAERAVPKMPRRQRSTPVNSRPMIVLGAVLLAGLTILAFAGGRLFGSATDQVSGTATEMQIAASGFPTPSGSPGAGSVPAVPTAALVAGQRAPIVCLDPGHGGPDTGFTQFWSELGFALVEKNLVLEHAWDLEARLKQHGYTVVMTRRTDVAVNATGEDVNGDGKTGMDDPPGSNEHRYRNLDEFQARINICNEANADLLVSMHVNGFSHSGPRGYETWYTAEREFGEQNRQFATLAYNALKKRLAEIGYTVDPSVERGVNPDTASDVQSPTTIYRHFIMTGPEAPGVIVPSAMPGAIVEALFVSNDVDAVVLASPSGRNAIVNAYEEAIVEYFALNPPE